MNRDQRAKIQALIEKGWDSRTIAHEIGVSLQTVAAVRAHTTMGTYLKTSGLDGSLRVVERKPNWARPTSHSTESGPTLQYLSGMIDKVEKKLRDYIDLALSAKSEKYLDLIPSDILQSADRKIEEHFRRHPYEKKQNLSNRQW